MAVEREIAAFLDEHLYNNKELFTEHVRTDSLEEQYSGSDLLLSTKDGKLNRSIVDEKVASRFANRKLDTFSLEHLLFVLQFESETNVFADYLLSYVYANTFYHITFLMSRS